MLFGLARRQKPGGVLEEDKSSQRENPLGSHQNAQKPTTGTSLSTGHKAPKDDSGHTAPGIAARRKLYQVHGL
jgi:hypothetical protein